MISAYLLLLQMVSSGVPYSLAAEVINQPIMIHDRFSGRGFQISGISALL
jgi:hypothetical protein